MKPASSPLTFDELAVIYRTEKASSPLTTVRPDFYQAAADLLSGLRREYQRQAAEDPDSVMAEGLNQRRKAAENQCKTIVAIRTKKIVNMSVLGAENAKVQVGLMTPEERDYYDGLVSLTKRHLSTVDALRGALPTVTTRIDEPPPAAGFPPAPPEEAMEEEPDFDEPFPEEEPATPEPTSDGTPDYEPVLIRVLEDLPEFVGPDRSYKLSKEDVVTLPKALADILVNTQKAVAVAPTP